MANTNLRDGLDIVDLDFQGRAGVIASYLIRDAGEAALVEIGPTSGLEALLRGLDSAGVNPSEISKLFITHIHLDHAGAAGTFMRRFPASQLYVHEVGVPHLVDPSKLVGSASRIYGRMMDSLWGRIDPVPAERITPLADGDTVSVGKLELTAIYTPGHAAHHVVFHDRLHGEVFTGDVAAVRLQDHGYIRPPTPPPDINLETWMESIERIRELEPQALHLTHFGRFTDVELHLRQTRDRLSAFAKLVERAVSSGRDREAIIGELQEYGDREIQLDAPDASALERYELATPYYMTVDGLLRYFRKRAMSQ